MTRIVIEIIKYLLIVLFSCYSFEGVMALLASSDEKKNRIYNRQTVFLFLIHLAGNLAVILYKADLKYVIMYFGELFILVFIQSIYNFFYFKASRLLCNHMCILLATGFIMLSRLDDSQAVRQMIFSAVACLFTFLLPFLFRKTGMIRQFGLLYGAAGIAALLFVFLFGGASYGANLSINLLFFSLQPSEFIKILFVLFVAAYLYKEPEIKRIVIVTVVAAVHVMILVVSKDLGAALIFFVTYIIMLYAATKQLRYLIGGLLLGVGASIPAYMLFSHVRARVTAFVDPLSVIDTAGYQVAQSLFAIGAGGFFGVGIFQGSPKTIPVVTKDFIFSAIAEEMGGIYAILIIFTYAGIYLVFLNLAMQMRDKYYRLIALGLGTLMGAQVILNIGGVIKALPSTGVTLPLLSYGGSSLFATFIIFAVIQGLYMHQMRELEKENGISETEDKKIEDNKTDDKETKDKEADGDIYEKMEISAD